MLSTISASYLLFYFCTFWRAKFTFPIVVGVLVYETHLVDFPQIFPDSGTHFHTFSQWDTEERSLSKNSGVQLL